MNRYWTGLFVSHVTHGKNQLYETLINHTWLKFLDLWRRDDTKRSSSDVRDDSVARRERRFVDPSRHRVDDGKTSPELPPLDACRTFRLFRTVELFWPFVSEFSTSFCRSFSDFLSTAFSTFLSAFLSVFSTNVSATSLSSSDSRSNRTLSVSTSSFSASA